MADGIDYRKAGVDIEAGEQAVDRIKSLARSTFRPEVLNDLGGFSGLFAPNLEGICEPVLVAGCDGVGTKLKIAFAVNKHDTVGIDCVAMCVNDILVQGAEPLFFLDYLAINNLQPDQVASIVSGVAEGCRQAGCALIGGEMAEMPGFYQPGEYDLAGFAVGIADRFSIVDGSALKPGDRLIGLASSGLHSNGYSLVRKILLEQEQIALTEQQPGFDATLADELLKPTRIYVKPVLKFLKNNPVRAMSHITGGGLSGNLKRFLPAEMQLEIDKSSWPVPRIFEIISKLGPVEETEMYRVFNMGIGYVLAVPEDQHKPAIDYFNASGIDAYLIGTVKKGKHGVVYTN